MTHLPRRQLVADILLQKPNESFVHDNQALPKESAAMCEMPNVPTIDD